MKLRQVLAGATAILAGAKLLKKAWRGRRAPSRLINSESLEAPSKVFRKHEGHIDKTPVLEYLIENELFYTCQLLPIDFFVTYCTERGLKISKEQLFEFERLGVFYPFARVTSATNVQWFWTEQVKGLLAEGAIQQPSSAVGPSNTVTVEHEGREFRSYYSKFQVYSLFDLLSVLERLTISPQKWLGLAKRDAATLLKRVTRNTEEVFSQYRVRTISDLAVAICQVISNRYYPNTQTDRRTIRVPSSDILNWDWYEYRRNWNPKLILAEIGIDETVLERLCYRLIIDAQEADPMQRWRELIGFVSVEKKEQLKGAAQLAQTLYSMEQMLNMFHKDLTGKGVYLFEQSPEDQDFFYGPGVSQNPLEFLEYLSNEFHLNPRPKLILVVEGDGEYKVFPELSAKIFSTAFSRVGIEIRKLRGIGDFKNLPKYIDANHDKQALVYVVLDNENNADKIKESLIKTPSEFFPKRTITRDEYVHLWDHSIEVDNFTFAEIARVLTEHCEGDYVFSEVEVEEAYDSKRGNPLKGLLDAKTGGRYSLKKVELLQSLFELIISSSQEEFEKVWAHRPIIRVLRLVTGLAFFNAQPQDQEAWVEVQKSGFFGHVLGTKENETRDYIRVLSDSN
jgi:hypothetical protein